MPDTTTAEGRLARQRQFDHEEVSRLEEMVKRGKEVGKVILFHKFGIGDCPCSNCNY